MLFAGCSSFESVLKSWAADFRRAVPASVSGVTQSEVLNLKLQEIKSKY